MSGKTREDRFRFRGGGLGGACGAVRSRAEPCGAVRGKKGAKAPVGAFAYLLPRLDSNQ